MVSKKQMLKVLDKGDVEAIHGATLEVLDKTGVLVNSDRALDLLEKKGLPVDRATRRVKMPESVVMESVRACKKNFKYHARNEKNTVQAVDGRTKLGPGAECVWYIDPESDEARRPVLKDGIYCCRLMDAMPEVSFSYLPMTAYDVPDECRREVSIIAGLVNSSKLTFGGSTDAGDVEFSIKIGEILRGDRESLMKKPLFGGYVDPISPLAHEHTMLEALLGYASIEAPVFVTVMALAGGTAPVSVAGIIAQQNAEVLSSIVIANCVTKAPKIIYGSVSCPLDMRSGSASTGSPEFSLIGVGAIQMAKYYKLPSNMGVQSDSKAVDEQTSYEKAFAAFAAFAAGADFSDLFVGSTESFNTYSPLQLAIDEEIAADAIRFSQGVEVNHETLSVELMEKVGPMGSYLKEMNTLMRFRKEHMMPKLSDRSSRSRWAEGGSKSAKERAKSRLAELMKSYQPDPLEPEQKKALNELLSATTKEFTVEKLEGPI
jgi:trimethylamine--corrinoid protein Co-methyltransferase